MKNSVSFHISAQNTDCWYLLETPRLDGSKEYPQSMFLSRSKKINVYPCCKSQFYCIKWEFKGVTTIGVFFVMNMGKKQLDLADDQENPRSNHTDT